MKWPPKKAYYLNVKQKNKVRIVKLYSMLSCRMQQTPEREWSM